MSSIGTGAPQRHHPPGLPLLDDAAMSETLRQLESDIAAAPEDTTVSNANTWPYNATRSTTAPPWPAPVGSVSIPPSPTSQRAAGPQNPRRLRATVGEQLDRAARPMSTVAVTLLPVRVFLALGWLRAAIEKVVERRWWSGELLDEFLVTQRSDALPFMPRLTDNVVAPLAQTIAIAVVFAQVAIALGFASKRTMRPALWAAITLNVAFIAMGVVTPSAFYLAIQLSLLTALNSGALGLPLRPPRRAAIYIMAVAAVACLPFVDTVHPARVIDDPAIMLATIAAIGAITQSLRFRIAPPDVMASTLE